MFTPNVWSWGGGGGDKFHNLCFPPPLYSKHNI